MEQQDIIMERNAERKERLLDIAEKIGYDTAISRLQQKLSENQAALTKQNVPLDSFNFRRMQIEIAFKQEVIQALKGPFRASKTPTVTFIQKSISGGNRRCQTCESARFLNEPRR